MQLRSLPIAVALCLLAVSQSSAQNITADAVDRFIKGATAETAALSTVEDQLAELNEKIRKFNECANMMREAGEIAGGKLGGMGAKIAMKAKCGATSDEGMRKDRSKLLENPEKAALAASGMKQGEYAGLKEKILPYLEGNRSYSPAALEVLAARATDLANALGVALAAAGDSGSDRSGGGGGNGNGRGNAIGARMAAFTPDMTWAYVTYLWSLLYVSGATMFETPYAPGQWTTWEIKTASDKDDKTLLERALISKDKDGSEWWRIKSINVDRRGADTLNFEVQLKSQGQGIQQVVRMRGKMPGDTEPKELMVPQHLTTLSASSFGMKPTAESVAAATVGTESVKTSTGTYNARHVKFGSGEGYMEWWIADNAPGSLVRIQHSGKDPDEKWTMELTGSGTGAKSELGVK